MEEWRVTISDPLTYVEIYMIVKIARDALNSLQIISSAPFAFISINKLSEML